MSEKECVYRKIANLHFKGVEEYRLPSGLIVDILNKDLAIEIDFVHKWAESIGQCLQYARESKRKPCICFIYDSVRDRKLIDLVSPLLKSLCIEVWTIDYLTRQIYLRFV